MMPIEAPQEQMWTLSEDRRYVRLSLPPLPIEGLPEPARVNMDFDAGTIDQIIERLSVLRAKMLPAPAKPN
jgi:hypothetical protein